MEQRKEEPKSQDAVWQLRHPSRSRNKKPFAPLPRPKKRQPPRDGQDSSKRG